MSDVRPAVKIDFTSGLEVLPPRPKMDASTTQASLIAGRQLGFAGKTTATKIDGRRLRSRGANTQLNLKVTAEEKDRILREASYFLRDPSSPVSNLGEFVLMAVDFFLANRP